MESESRLADLVKSAKRRFEEEFGRSPRWVAAAPGRVNLIGEHTDYNDGFVLPMAIDRYVVMAAAGRGDCPDFPAHEMGLSPSQARLFSTALHQRATIAVDGDIRPGLTGWASYVQGVVAGCLAAGLAPGSFDAVIHSNVPVGGGVSSSAALEVAAATLIEAITGQTLDPVQKALLCQRAEHDYAGVPCGIMDQFSSVMAKRDHLMLLDCRTQSAKMVPLADPNVSVLIVNSNVKHELAGSEYAQRRAECASAARALGAASLRDVTGEQLEEARDRLAPGEFRRARHVIRENGRTVEAARAIGSGDWAAAGELMYASHRSLRDDYEVSCDELDRLVELARSLGSEAGVIGSRMTGGGFGGCTVSLVHTGRLERVIPETADAYRRQTGVEATVLVTRPVEGARAVMP